MQGCSCSGGASLMPHPTLHILEEVFVDPQGLREDSVPRDSGISPELLVGKQGVSLHSGCGHPGGPQESLIPHS